MSVNWHQVGTDFHQKYEGTFCRFISPMSKHKEVFSINEIEVLQTTPPNLTLWNPKHGELYLKYTTEAELDFTYPDVGYFQHGKKAFRFTRNYERQWKKGICSATARILYPYNAIV